MMSKKLILIDGHSILNRAFFGIPDLTNSEGIHTNAMYGFLNIMFKFIDEEKPDYITVAFDLSEPTFRHKAYEAYKGTRKPMAPELKQQVPLIKELLRMMNITVIEKAGYEADDIIGTIAKRSAAAGIDVSVISGDRDLLQLAEDKKEAFEQIVSVMEKETGLDREAAIADMRFQFIGRLCEKTVVRPHESKEHRRSVKIDKLLTGKYTAIPCFIGIMAIVFAMTFSLLGAWLSDVMALGVDAVIGWIDKGLIVAQINPVVRSLVVDGICQGVGSVISFLPTIVILFFFLSILEDTGYMARVAFVMDKPLRKIGLSGRSFVPMLIGFGCSVPAIMATRTLSSERDRKMTILLTPFMSCSAKLPIYTLMISAFVQRQYRVFAMVGLYLIGIVCAVIYALILKVTKFKGEPVPFVMELPNYRLPSAKSVLHLIWEKAKGFIQKAFTIIFLASIIIWFLQTFDLRFNVAASADQSMLALIGSLIAPIFKPLGFGDWRVSTALITGFTAKESVVSTLTVLLGGDVTSVATLFTPFTAMVFLIFTLLYTPCVAAIATVKREMGGTKAAVITVIVQCLIAWVVAFLVHAVGLAFGVV